MDNTGRRRRIQHLGTLLTVLCLAVVGVSAWLRLAGAGLGCQPWPVCYASFLNGTPYALPEGGRVIHRVIASSALLLAFYACWRSLKPMSLQPLAKQALLLTCLMLLLSVIGIWSNDPRRVLVNFVNLLGGLALVSFSWRLVLASSKETMPHASSKQDKWLTWGLLTLTASVLLGALIGASYAATACTTLPDCGGKWWPSAWGGLDLLKTLTESVPAENPEGAALHLLHRYCALMTLLLLGTSAWRRLASKDALIRRNARVVLGLLAGEAVLGVMTVATGYTLYLAIAHNMGAAALLAAVAQLSVTGQAQQEK